jgi:hypothetical protein
MVNLIYIFWMYVILFAVIGIMRGWAKELLVSFSVILALALTHLLQRYIPMFQAVDGTSLFWIRTWITVGLVYFGYQTVGNIGALSGKARKEKLQDALFGGVMGATNGYLIVGTIWSYLHDAGYPFGNIFFFDPNVPAITGIYQTIETMMLWMPPHAFGEPGIYFAVMIAFVFVIVVFV